MADARDVVGRYVDHHNDERLHCAIGYVASAAALEGRNGAIHAVRRTKLDVAGWRRKMEAQKGVSPDLMPDRTGAMIEPAGEMETALPGGNPIEG